MIDPVTEVNQTLHLQGYPSAIIASRLSVANLPVCVAATFLAALAPLELQAGALLHHWAHKVYQDMVICDGPLFSCSHRHFTLYNCTNLPGIVNIGVDRL